MQPANGTFSGDHVLMEKEGGGLALLERGFGANLRRAVKLSLHEALFLAEQERLEVRRGKNVIGEDGIRKAGLRFDKDFSVKHAVFADLRGKGYIVKTALKFGADFRVYDKGVKPGKDHAKWIVYPVRESQRMSWYDFAAKNRVAHSTRKRLLIAIVDAEEDVTYFEVGWERP